VYTLIKVNHLIRKLSLTKSTYPIKPTYITKPILLLDKFPTYLKPYLDVFSPNYTRKLAPYKNVDLAINLQPRSKPLYSLIYPLS
jgi:hypothetical protein